MSTCFMGVDLTGSPRKSTAIFIIDNELAPLFIGFFSGDAELLALVERYSPCHIAIDAPLGLPAGLCCLEENCLCHPATSEKGRSCERELAQSGMPCYFTTKKSIIKCLVYRGIALKEGLEGKGYRVIEVYPHASKIRLFGRPLPKKTSSAGLNFLRGQLIHLLPRLAPYGGSLSHDLCDAAIAAYTAFLNFHSQTEVLGKPEEGVLCIPAPPSRLSLP